MSAKTEVWQGTLALMVLETLNAMGPQHGYGIARRIEQTSENLLSINQVLRGVLRCSAMKSLVRMRGLEPPLPCEN